MNNDKIIRAFLAIDLFPEVRKKIDNIQTKLKRSCPFDVRWTKPEGIHLALKFLGDISAEDIMKISPAVETEAMLQVPLHLNVHRLGLFPSIKHPRVLWIGVGGDVAPLLTLQNNL